MVPPASHGIPRAPRYSGYHYIFPHFVYETFTLFGIVSQHISTMILELRYVIPQPLIQVLGLASFLFARRYLGNRLYLSLPRPT